MRVKCKVKAMNAIRAFLGKHRSCSAVITFLYRYVAALKWFYLAAAGTVPLHLLRHTLYRILGLKLGGKSVIYGGAEVRGPQKIMIGNNTFIGHQAILDGRGGLIIGNNVNFSTGVWIWTAQHDKNDPDFKVIYGSVVIEDYVWVSCRVTILPNTHIGKGAVIAAGAVVKGIVPPFAIIGGVPGKVIGERNHDLKYTLEGSIPFI